MIPYITDADVQKRLTEKKAFALARDVFLMIAKGHVQMPPKVYLNISGPPAGDFRAMPAYLGTGRGGAVGIKWISVFPDNRKKGLPTVKGTLILNSATTGMPLMIIEANALTAIRTAAAAALATHCLANPKPRKLAIVGAGLQAEYQLRALADRYRFVRIAVWGFTGSESKNFCKRLSGKFPGLEPAREIKECVHDADIIVTCTPSRKPLIKNEWVKPGAHINAIGADAKGKEELDPKLVRAAKVVVDEWEQASHSGEINVPVSKGLFSKKRLQAELAQVVSGSKKGRSASNDITIFDSTGLAALDVYFAAAVYRTFALE